MSRILLITNLVNRLFNYTRKHFFFVNNVNKLRKQTLFCNNSAAFVFYFIVLEILRFLEKLYSSSMRVSFVYINFSQKQRSLPKKYLITHTMCNLQCIYIYIYIYVYIQSGNDGRCTCEIKSRIAMAKAAFSKKKTLFTRKLDLNLRRKLIKCYIWSMALYGAEIWTLRAADQKYLESLEMWCWRRMEKISWTDHVRN